MFVSALLYWPGCWSFLPLAMFPCFISGNVLLFYFHWPTISHLPSPCCQQSKFLPGCRLQLQQNTSSKEPQLETIKWFVFDKRKIWKLYIGIMVGHLTGPVKSEERSENGRDLSALDRGSHQLQWNEPISESENKNAHFSTELKKVYRVEKQVDWCCKLVKLNSNIK